MTAPPRPARRGVSDRTVRIGAVAPVAVLGTVAFLEADPATRVSLGVALLVLAAIVVTLTSPRVASMESAGSRVPLVLGLLALGASLAVLVGASRFDARSYTVVLGVITVAGAFTLPHAQRRILVIAAAAVWAISVPLVGVHDPAALATQAGGALLLAVTVLRTTRSLEAAIAVERSAAASAAARTGALATVLRLQSLEPGAVLDGVVQGARDVGFDSAILRVPEAGGLRLAAARPAPGESPPRLLPPGQGISSRALERGATVVVDDHFRYSQELHPMPTLHGAIAAPVILDGEIVAVLLARQEAHGISVEQQDAIDLLVEEAAWAFVRARRFATAADHVVELQRLDARTQDFVSTVSHELRTPMTVVTGLGTTLRRRWDDLEPDRRADLLRRIHSNADRLADMVHSLLDTSALERGQLRVVAEPTQVAAIVDNVRTRLAPLFETHDVHADVDPDLWVQADPGLLAHVVENLLGNAARHTPPGTTVTVRARRAEDDVEVEVADDGPGIAAEDLPHVLERFFRAGAATTRTPGGLGLGLALSQEILAAHGRAMVVASDPGEGARFSFRLAAAPPPPGRG